MTQEHNMSDSTSPELLRQQQAAEYVLGTLEEPARTDFERQLQHDAAAAATVAYWERALAPLAEAIQPVTPPKRLWRQLHQRLQPIQLRRQLRWWQGLAVAASVFAVAMLLTVIVSQPEPAIEYEQTLVMQSEAEPSLWLLRMDDETQQIAVEALRQSTFAQADNDFELWVIDSTGPISLGLLPKTGDKVLKSDQYAKLDGAVALAVSLEAKGGSTTGQPSEQVLYQAKL